MTALRPQVLVALFCLFTLATSASAECAWVMWDETRGQTRTTSFTKEGPSITIEQSDVWDIGQVFPSQRVCQAAAQQRLNAFNAFLQADHKRTVVGGDTIFVTSTDRVSYRFACFPDTVDPRGSRGK